MAYLLFECFCQKWMLPKIVQIYLDMCSLQRPIDTKTQLKIILEGEAITGIIALCELGEIDLIYFFRCTFI